MEGENLTPFPAMLLRTVIDEERMAVSMMARVTYDLDGETLKPADEQPWIVSAEPWSTPLGEFSADQPFRRDGVDLFVMGDAFAPGGVPAPRVDLRFSIGEFEASGVAFGARVWQKNARGELQPSDPEPFVSMPLGWEMAFGGTVTVDDLVAPYPLNGRGVGLYIDEQAALGKPLPRLEDPAALVKRWDDRPDPIGFGLCQFPEALRLRESAEIVDDKFKSFRLRMYNRAFPAMIAPSAKPGDRVRLEGFSPDGPITFVVPASHLLVRLTLGEKLVERTPTIEEVGVDPAHRKVFIGYRYPFRYVFVPEQLRTCVLLPLSE